MFKKPFIVTLAGVPGVGKTTMSHLIKGEIEGSVLFKRIGQNPIEIHAVSIAAFLTQQQQRIAKWDQRYIRYTKHKSVANCLICDRGIEDIMCFTEYIVSMVYKEPSYDITYMWEKNIKSDLVLYLFANKDTLNRRKAERYKENFGRGGFGDYKYWNYYHSWFESKENTVFLDTSNMTQEETVAHIIGLLKERLDYNFHYRLSK